MHIYIIYNIYFYCIYIKCVMVFIESLFLNEINIGKRVTISFSYRVLPVSNQSLTITIHNKKYVI